ncbi:DUF2937 family protein [Vibrio algivorus]|nr:DUF2937 family protein [Vibrio algivorus]GLT13541.1 hypothetical protein GCM10007931_05150 [Vibrio algivorus]
MKKIIDYLKLAVLIFGVLIGVQIPGFVSQYGQNLDARVAESSQGLSQFQDDADQYFNGSLEQLLKHYARNQDPVIVAGGKSIKTLVARNQMLTQAQSNFHQSRYSPYLQVFVSPISEIRQDVWNHYEYKVILNAEAISIGAIFGLMVLALSELVLFILSLLLKSLLGKPYKANRKMR